MRDYDVIIIGAGPGGYRAAQLAAQRGLAVLLFEAGDVGGTCLNVGCIPTKTYAYARSFAEARERMPQVVAQLRAGVETLMQHPNITLRRERAEFTDAHTVNGCTARHIIIATGSATRWIDVRGLDDPRVVDSTGLLSLDEQPKKLAVVGAGVVGMEFASAFHRFGTEVTVVEYLRECLPTLDSDIAKRLRKYLERQGIAFRMKTAVQNLAELDADVVLMATGRRPRVQADFDRAGIEWDERTGVRVDDNFQTCQPGIYAIGDVNGRQMLAHAAEMQALRVVNHLTGRADGIRFDIMPSAIFTTPEAACVGPTEEQLRAQGHAYQCRKAFWRSNGKAVAMDQTEGMLKLFVANGAERGEDSGASADDGLILGCHAYGAHAADMVQEVSALMCRNTTIGQLADMVHIHPTLSEVLRAAAE